VGMSDSTIVQHCSGARQHIHDTEDYHNKPQHINKTG